MRDKGKGKGEGGGWKGESSLSHSPAGGAYITHRLNSTERNKRESSLTELKEPEGRFSY